MTEPGNNVAESSAGNQPSVRTLFAKLFETVHTLTSLPKWLGFLKVTKFLHATLSRNRWTLCEVPKVICPTSCRYGYCLSRASLSHELNTIERGTCVGAIRLVRAARSGDCVESQTVLQACSLILSILLDKYSTAVSLSWWNKCNQNSLFWTWLIRSPRYFEVKPNPHGLTVIWC